MVILGFMLNYALRVNLTIAIVEMVAPTPTETIANGNSSIIFNTTVAPVNTTVKDFSFFIIFFLFRSIYVTERELIFQF